MNRLIHFLFIISSIKGANAQYFNSLTIKGGINYAGQNSNPPPGFGGGGNIYASNMGLEAAFYSFGKNKRLVKAFEINYTGKGGINSSPIITYNTVGEPIGSGNENYKVKLQYLSLASNLVYQSKSGFFLKIGFRSDILMNVQIHDKFDSDQRTKKDFTPVNWGLNFGNGFLLKREKISYLFELMYQPDFNHSAFYETTKTRYNNYSVVLNLGLVFHRK